MAEKNCLHCGDSFHCTRNKHQKYCSKKACQNQRRLIWLKNKLKEDPDYRANQKASEKQWQSRKENYWRDYRVRHPEYTKRNRQLQRKRNKKRGGKEDTAKPEAVPLPLQALSDLIATSYALSPQPLVKPGVYQIEFKSPLIATSYAFVAQLVEI